MNENTVPQDYNVISTTINFLPEKLQRVSAAKATVSETQQVLRLESEKLKRMLDLLSRKFDTRSAKEEDLSKAKQLFKLKDDIDLMYERAKHLAPEDPQLVQIKQHAKTFLEEQLIPEKIKSLKEQGLMIPPEFNDQRSHEISLKQAINAIVSADRRIKECVLKRYIDNKANNLPPEWLDKGTLSDEEWVLKASSMIALAAQCKLLISMANKLQDITPDFYARLPKCSCVEQDCDGKIFANVHLCLPKTLDGSTKADNERIYELQKWLSTEGTRMSNLLKVWIDFQY